MYLILYSTTNFKELTKLAIFKTVAMIRGNCAPLEGILCTRSPSLILFLTYYFIYRYNKDREPYLTIILLLRKHFIYTDSTDKCFEVSPIGHPLSEVSTK